MKDKLCRDLLYGRANWTVEALEKLNIKHLQALAWILAIPKSGSKAAQVARLLDLRALRVELGRFGDAPHDLVEVYLHRELKDMVRRTRSWCGGNKLTIAATLLNWRNTCRTKGMQRLKAIQAQNSKGPRQLRLMF